MRLTAEGYELSRDDQLEWFLYPLLRNGRSTQDVSHWDFLRGINWLFEKSRLTKNINKAVFTLTDPYRFFPFRYWIRVPEDPTNCIPDGWLLCDGGRRNKGEIDNENRLITYGRVPV